MRSRESAATRAIVAGLAPSACAFRIAACSSVRAAARRGSSRSIFSAAMAIRFMVSALVFTLAMVEGLHLDSPVRRHDREVADCSRVDPADSLRGGKVGRRSARLAQPPLADKNAPSGSDAFEDTEPFLVA